MPQVAEKNEELIQMLEKKMEKMFLEKIKEMNLVQKTTPASSPASLDEKFYMLSERIVRVEEELKHQREILIDLKKESDKRFEQVDKRFEQIDKRFEQVDKRFEQVDKRFEQVDKRFEQIDKRFVFMQWLIMIGFVSLGTLVSIIRIIG